MRKVKLVIVGGIAGGTSAAVRTRRLSETAEITLLERGAYVSFANCGLPYHIGGETPKRQQLLLKTPQDFPQRFNIDVHIGHRVLQIRAGKKVVHIRNEQTGEVYHESYDQFLLSTRGSPIRPPLPGVDLPGIFTLRTLPDMDNILAHIHQHRLTHATIVGDGFIGLGMAETLVNLGIRVTLLGLGTQVMAPVDAEMATVLHQVLQQEDIDLRLQSGLATITQVDDTQGLQLSLNTDEVLATRMVLLAINVEPGTQLASSAKLVLGPRGGILINPFIRTSGSCIYAVGNVVETVERVTGNATSVSLVGPASRQGRIAAENMLGEIHRYQRNQVTAICKVFDHAIVNVGLNGKTVQRLNMNYEKVYVHAAHHADYYPGNSPVSLKLLFSPDTGDILGAQAVGEVGIDRCIDVLAVAQWARLEVQDLKDLELCYTPPFDNARDVVNQVGMLVTSAINGDTRIYHVADILNISPSQQYLLDVRTSNGLKMLDQYPEALHIPVDELRSRLNELPKGKEILIDCQSGLRGHVVYRLLRQQGFRARNLSRGCKTYQLSLAEL